MLPPTQVPSDIEYVAEVRGVREVGLMAVADKTFWDRRLAPQGLRAMDFDGRAQVLFTAVRARWMGVGFHDFSFGVFAESLDPQRASPGAEQGLFFVSAFNSSRFFALVERRWFRTPYRHRPALGLDVRMPVWADLGADGARRADLAGTDPKAPFAVAMGAVDGEERRAASSAEVAWEGPLFLPGADGGTRRHFFVRMTGHTRTYPFDESVDQVRLGGPGAPAVIADLHAGGFDPQQWVVRADAVHARSKTYKSPALASRA